MGDPDYVEVPVARLLSREHAAAHAASIRAGERASVTRRTTDALEAMGYAVKRNPMGFAFAALHGIRTVEGRLESGADPQRDGMVLLVG